MQDNAIDGLILISFTRADEDVLTSLRSSVHASGSPRCSYVNQSKSVDGGLE